MRKCDAACYTVLWYGRWVWYRANGKCTILAVYRNGEDSLDPFYVEAYVLILVHICTKWVAINH
jgi:hypothetical protein